MRIAACEARSNRYRLRSGYVGPYVTERYRDKTVYGRPPGSGLEGRTSEVCCNIGGGINRRLLSLSCELARAPKARPRAKTGSPVFHCDTQVMSGRASDVKLVQSCGGPSNPYSACEICANIEHSRRHGETSERTVRTLNR